MNSKLHYQEAPSAGVCVSGLEVPKKSRLSYSEFAEQFLFPNKPVVVTDAMDDWPALKRWTPQFLQANYPKKEVTIDGKTYPFSEFIDWVLRSSEKDPAPYLRNQVVADLFPELKNDVST